MTKISVQHAEFQTWMLKAGLASGSAGSAAETALEAVTCAGACSASDGNGTSYAEYTDYATFYAGKNDLYATYDSTEDDGTEDDGTEDNGSTDDDGDAEPEGLGVSGELEKLVEPGQPSAPDASVEPVLPQIPELKVEEPSAPAVPEIPAEPVTYTVTYKVGDTEISSASYLAGEMATVEYYYGELVKEYIFAGWQAVDSEGNATGTVYAEGDTFEVTSDVILVAVWSEVVVEAVEPEVLPEEPAEDEDEVPLAPESEEPKANYDDQVMPIPE